MNPSSPNLFRSFAVVRRAIALALWLLVFGIVMVSTTPDVMAQNGGSEGAENGGSGGESGGGGESEGAGSSADSEVPAGTGSNSTDSSDSSTDSSTDASSDNSTETSDTSDSSDAADGSSDAGDTSGGTDSEADGSSAEAETGDAGSDTGDGAGSGESDSGDGSGDGTGDNEAGSGDSAEGESESGSGESEGEAENGGESESEGNGGAENESESEHGGEAAADLGERGRDEPDARNAVSDAIELSQALVFERLRFIGVDPDSIGINDFRAVRFENFDPNIPDTEFVVNCPCSTTDAGGYCSSYGTINACGYGTGDSVIDKEYVKRLMVPTQTVITQMHELLILRGMPSPGSVELSASYFTPDETRQILISSLSNLILTQPTGYGIGTGTKLKSH